MHLIAALLLASPAFSWGPLGHRAVAKIAEERVSSQTKAQLNSLLGVADGLERVASCADEILHSRGSVRCGGLVSLPADGGGVTKDWHYMNIPVGEAVTAREIPRFCPNGNDCVWAQVHEQVDALREASTPQKKKVALMYLVHFVGDLHQPLHVADDGDRGGTQSSITLGDVHKSLHQLWDGIILFDDDLDPLMSRLNADIARADTASWLEGDLATAAVLEGHAFARETLYPDYRATNGRLAADYQKRMQPVAFDRLERAGVRLAALLDSAFAAPGPRSVDTKLIGLALDRALSESPVR